MIEVKLLLLLVIVNGAPICARFIFGNRSNFPVDFGIRLPDTYPLFGESKTWRGVITAIMAGMIMAPLLGFSLEVGFIVGSVSMLGDLFSSFLKRRLGMVPSSMALGLDQIPESLFPLLAVSQKLHLSWLQILSLVLLFFIIELSLSRLLYRLKIRKRPY